MPRTPRLLPMLLVLVLVLPAAGEAQLPFEVAIEGRVGLANPTGEFAGEGADFSAESGLLLAGALTVLPSQHFGIFVGYQQSRFGCERCEATGLEGRVVAEGPEGGVHLALPLLDRGLSVWLRGGIAQQTLTFSGFDDELSSKPEIGAMGAAGVSIPLAGGLGISPSVRVSSVPAEFEFSSFSERSVQVSAISLDLALDFRF